MSELNIVIPMAGKGSRFTDAGYDVAKPFITFDGRTMIEHVLNSLPIENNIVTLIIQKDFEEQYASQLKSLRDNYNLQWISVDGITAGAACTGLAARRVINDKTAPALLVDCDNIFQVNHVKDFINDAKNRELDGSLLTFSSDSPKFSYVQLDSNMLAIRLREKEVISSHAVAGAYYFSSYKTFEDYAIEMMMYGNTLKNEYYMSNVYNYLISNQGRVGIWEVTAHDFACVGTPEQLKIYLKSEKQ